MKKSFLNIGFGLLLLGIFSFSLPDIPQVQDTMKQKDKRSDTASDTRLRKDINNQDIYDNNPRKPRTDSVPVPVPPPPPDTMLMR